jgi:sugar lactone lactonase YvrE
VTTGRLALAAGDHLGEGPSWQAEAGELTWVDITGGLLRRWRPADDHRETLELGAPLSFAIAREGGGWAVGRSDRIGLIDPEGHEATLLEVHDAPPHTRFNDAKCDAAGRLWAGTMSTERTAGDGRLYRIDPDGESEVVISSTTISNGLGWSPTGDLFFFVDSTAQAIDVFDFDVATGRIENRRTFADIDAADGLPDGLAVDADGGIWVGLFGGGAVRRYNPDGSLDAVVDLPVSNPTCPVFGGAGLDRLYITSARHKLTSRQLAQQPLAGGIFEVAPGGCGLPGNRFAG